MGLTRHVLYTLAAALLLPLGVSAASHNCNPPAPTSESYTADPAREANELLGQVRSQAYDVKREADGLANLSRFNQVDWRILSNRLNEIRDHVNAMGESMCRLNQIRSAVLPWQRQEIDRVMPALVELADSTRSAIEQFNSHETNFWATKLPEEAADIYSEAGRLHGTVARQAVYAKASGSSPSAPTGM